MAEHTIAITLNIVGTGDTAQEAQANARQKIITVVRAVCENGDFNGAITDANGLTQEATLYARRWLMTQLRNEVFRWQHNQASRTVVPEDVDIR